MIAAALRVEHLSKSYRTRRTKPQQRALDRVDLEIPTGQSVALLGPNGSGKSTLLRIIVQTLLPDEGAVEVFGSRDPQHIRRCIGVVFQSPGLDRHMTVMENLRDYARLYGLSRREASQRAEESLRNAELTDRRRSLVKTLSGGLARRVDLCRAMLQKPQLLMLDEPTAGLDPSARETFLRSLEQGRADHGLTILMTTHLTDEADRCDRVVLLNEGRIVADDSPQNLRRKLGRRRITVFSKSDAIEAGAGHVSDLRHLWTQIGGGFSAPLPNDEDQSKRIVAALIEHDIAFTIAPPTLADVFEHLTGRALQERKT